MEFTQACPCCGTKFRSDVKHEFTKANGRWEMILDGRTQSSNVDTPKIDGCFPAFDDGQELVVTAERLEENRVRLHISRRPRTNDPQATRVQQTQKKSRKDLLTEAAERGIAVHNKMSDAELVAALTAPVEMP